MKILYLASSADFHVDLWVKYFTKKNEVYLFSDAQNYLKDQCFENVEVIKSNGFFGKILNKFKLKNKKPFQVNKLVSVKYFAFIIDNIIKNKEIDIIHAHSLYFGFLNYFIKSKITKIFTPMGSDIILDAENKMIYKHMAKKAYIGSNVITGDSMLIQKKGYLYGATSKDNYVIQNGVDTKIFFPKKNHLRKLLNVNQNEILLFSPRALSPLYNIEIILYAIKILSDKNIKLKCMFTYAFGDEYTSYLKKISKNLNLESKLIWLGFKRYEEMAEIYNASDLVISIPSSDSSPKSVYEAILCKKPTIISNLQWSYEFFGDPNSIFRINKIDPKELAEKILFLITNSSYKKTVTQKSFSIAKKIFDYEKNMKNLEYIMSEKIKEQKSDIK